MFFINHTDGIACISDAGCHFASEITYFSLSTVLSVQILRFQDPGIAFHNTVNFFFLLQHIQVKVLHSKGANSKLKDFNNQKIFL